MPIKRHGLWNSPTYKTWQQMKQRCSNPNSTGYATYGGRGIRYCAEWEDFINFIEDMGIRPKGMTLDRIDSDVGYCAGNCRWASPKEQANNRTNNVRVLWGGQILTPSEMVHVWGRPLQTVYYRLGAFFTIDSNMGLYVQSKPIITRNRNKN